MTTLNLDHVMAWIVHLASQRPVDILHLEAGQPVLVAYTQALGGNQYRVQRLTRQARYPDRAWLEPGRTTTVHEDGIVKQLHPTPSDVTLYVTQVLEPDSSPRANLIVAIPPGVSLREAQKGAPDPEQAFYDQQRATLRGMGYSEIVTKRIIAAATARLAVNAVQLAALALQYADNDVREALNQLKYIRALTSPARKREALQERYGVSIVDFDDLKCVLVGAIRALEGINTGR